MSEEDYQKVKLLEKILSALTGKNVKFTLPKKNSIKIGYIQSYFLENSKKFLISDISKGIDLFIGEENFLNQGIGTAALKIFLRNYVFIDDSVKYACIDPEVKNKRAIRAYEKVGFKHVNTDYDDYSKLLTYYMVIDRDDFLTLSDTMV